MTDDSDEALVARANSGEEDAFARLVARHYDRIFRIAWRWLGERAEAEDVAQDVCVRLARALRGFRGEAAFTTWLTRLAINAAKDALRVRARQRRDVVAIGLVADPAVRVDEALEGEDLWRAVRALSARQRDALLLVYGEGMSHAEAAALIGCGEKTLSWHVHEAKKTLRCRLKDA